MASALERFENWFDALVDEDTDSKNQHQPKFLQRAREYRAKPRRGSQGGLLPNLTTRKLLQSEEQLEKKCQKEANQGYYELVKRKRCSTKVSQNDRKYFESLRMKVGFSDFEYIGPAKETIEKPIRMQLVGPLEPGVFFVPVLALLAQRIAMVEASRITGHMESTFNLVPSAQIASEIQERSAASKLSNGLSCVLQHDSHSKPYGYQLSEKRSTMRKVGPLMSAIQELIGNSNLNNYPIAVAKWGYVDSDRQEYRTCCEYLYSCSQIVNAVAQGASGPVLVQKFIKAKGKTPWKLRVAWNNVHGCSKAWLLKSKQEFQGSENSNLNLPSGEMLEESSELEVVELDSQNNKQDTAKWGLVRGESRVTSKGSISSNQLGVSSSTAEHCLITAVPPHGWSEPCDMVSKLESSLRHNVGLKLEQLVCDLIQDDNDEWWLVQVKGFKLRAGESSRVDWLEGRCEAHCLVHQAEFQNKLQRIREEVLDSTTKTKIRDSPAYDKTLVLQAISQRKQGLPALPVDQPESLMRKKDTKCVGAYCADHTLAIDAKDGTLGNTNSDTPSSTHKISYRLILRDVAARRANQLEARDEDDGDQTLAGKYNGFITSKERREKNKVVKVCDRCYEIYSKQQDAAQSVKRKKILQEKARTKVSDAACERLYQRFQNSELARQKEGLELMFSNTNEHTKGHTKKSCLGRRTNLKPTRDPNRTTILALKVGDRVMHYRPRDGVERAGTVVEVNQKSNEDVMEAKYKVQLDMGKVIQNVRAHRLIRIGESPTLATSEADWLIGLNGNGRGEEIDLTCEEDNVTLCPLGCGENIQVPGVRSGVPLTLAASHHALQVHLAECKLASQSGQTTS